MKSILLVVAAVIIAMTIAITIVMAQEDAPVLPVLTDSFVESILVEDILVEDIIMETIIN